MKNQQSSARIACATISSGCGGGAYSSAISKHKYASPPPRKPKKIKRNMADQFCTLHAPSERLEMHKDNHGWGLRPAINSGESTTKAQDKFVPAYVQKGQYGTTTPLRPVVEVFVPSCAIAARKKEKQKERARLKKERAIERDRLAKFQRLFL